MATYMSGMSDQFNDTPRPQLNYSMLAQQQQTANTMFEQQVQSAKSDYSAALNLAVTGQDAEALKAGYITEAQKKLREVATQDLLLPKTAAQAQQVFEPFWSDERLLLNSGHTKNMSSGIAKVQRGMLSTDDDERKLYDVSQLQYLQGTQLELERAGTDLNKLRAIRKRGIIPVRNVMDHLRQAAIDQKMEVKRDTTGGYYLESKEGGPDSVPNFSNFAAGLLNDPSWKQQFEMYGQIDVDNRKRNLLAENPNLTDEELTAAVPKDIIQNMDKMFETQLSDVGTQLKSLEEQKTKILQRQKEQILPNGQKKKVILDSDVEDFEAIKRSIRVLSFSEGMIRGKKEQWDDDKAHRKEYIYSNPAQYLGEIQKQRSIESFASVMSAKETTTYKLNQAYKELQDNNRAWATLRQQQIKDQQTYQLGLANVQIEQTKNYINAAKEGLIKMDKRLTDSLFPGATPGSAVDGGIGDITYNPDPTSTQEVDAFGNIMNDITTAQAQKNQALLGVGQGEGGNYLIGNSSPLGVIEVSDMSTVGDALNKKNEDPDYKYTSVEEQALKKVGSLLGLGKEIKIPYAATSDNIEPDFSAVGSYGSTPKTKDLYKDPVAMELAIRNYITKLAGDGTKKNPDDPGAAALVLLETVANKERTINKTLSLLNEAKQSVISNDPKYAVLNLTPKELKKDFPSITVVGADGKEETISSEKYAELWLSGAIERPSIFNKRNLINMDVNNLIEINGNPYNISKIKYNDGNEVSYDQNITRPNIPLVYVQQPVQESFNNSLNYLENTYGKSKDLSLLRKHANNKAAEMVPGWKDLTGNMGRTAMIRGNNPIAINVMAAITNVEGNKGYYTQDNKPITEAADIQAINNVLNTLDQNGKQLKYVSYTYHNTTKGAGGRDAIEIHFKPYNEEGADKVNVENSKLADVMKQGSIRVDIDPNSKNTAIQKLIATQEPLLYADYYKPGFKKIPSAAQIASGYNVVMESYGPIGSNRATNIKMYGSYKMFNPTTGKKDITKTISRDISLNEKTAEATEMEWMAIWADLLRYNQDTYNAKAAGPQTRNVTETDIDAKIAQGQ
jgi:hypothetical protein